MFHVVFEYVFLLLFAHGGCLCSLHLSVVINNDRKGGGFDSELL